MCLILAETISRQKCGWDEGLWELRELELIDEAADALNKKLNGKIHTAVGQATISKIPTGGGGMAPPGILKYIFSDILYLSDLKTTTEEWYRFALVHEFGHVWDYRSHDQLSENLMKALNTWVCKKDPLRGEEYCQWDPYNPIVDPITKAITYPEPPPDTPVGCDKTPPGPNNNKCPTIPYSSTYGNGGAIFTGPGAEDWANSLAYYVYPSYRQGIDIGLRPIRRQYVEQQIKNLP